VLPLLGGLLGVALGVVDVQIDRSIHLPADWTYSSSTASTVLSAIVGAMAALTGFVVTVTVLVVQMATGTFSARYMRLWYRDRMLKATLALLIGTLAFSFSLLRRVDTEFVPNLGVTIAGVLVIASLLVFVIFLDRYLHRLRPVAVTVLVAGYVQRDFQHYFAGLITMPDVFSGALEGGGEQPALVVRSTTPGSIQAIDAHGLVEWARRHDCLVVVHHTVGDFVPVGAELLEAYGGDQLDNRSERRLLGMVALGPERTIDQDPAFAIRIMVDIAERALSPAVNDPTTAVQVLDHLGDVLRVIGETDLAQSRWTGARAARTGLVIPVRRWEDYLALGTTEIRQYGAAAIQVMRRMRAMLEELHDQVLPQHRPAVEQELERLDATVARRFGDSVDLDRASTADPQGIGGRTAREAVPAERITAPPPG
jgi:uncharacterized membrane protein